MHRYHPPSGGGGGTGGLLDNFRLWGFSTSRNGLGGGTNADWLSRVSSMATNAGVSVSSLKAAAIYHDYNSGFTSNVSGMNSFSFVAGNGIGAILQNQKLDDGSDASLQSWANGGYDTQMQTYLTNVSSWCASNSKQAILVLHHEPENDVNTQQAGWWSQGEARWIKMIYDYDDPAVIACVNFMWNPGGNNPVADAFDFTAPLLSLCGNDAVYVQAVLDRTLLGFDPYPEVSSGTPGTVLNRISGGLDYWRGKGLKNYYLPEVGLFHWNKSMNDVTNSSGVILQTDTQIAQRHHDNFCVDLAGAITGNGQTDCYLRGAAYFDVSDWNSVNYRSPTREFGIGKIDANGNTVPDADTAISLAPKTLAHYAQVILGTPHARPS